MTDLRPGKSGVLMGLLDSLSASEDVHWTMEGR